MAFKKMDKTVFPPRQWALVGYPGSGKSTFAAQMTGPMLVVDADHRFAEVARLAAGEIFQLSDEPADNINAERIAALLKENMAGSGIKTVVIDSLTSILSPLIVEAILDNDAGRNRNRVARLKTKRSPCACCKTRSPAGAWIPCGFIICAAGWTVRPARWRAPQSVWWNWPGCGVRSTCSCGSYKKMNAVVFILTGRGWRARGHDAVGRQWLLARHGRED